MACPCSLRHWGLPTTTRFVALLEVGQAPNPPLSRHVSGLEIHRPDSACVPPRPPQARSVLYMVVIWPVMYPLNDFCTTLSANLQHLQATAKKKKTYRVPRLDKHRPRPRKLAHQPLGRREPRHEPARRHALEHVFRVPRHEMPVVDNVLFSLSQLPLVSTTQPTYPPKGERRRKNSHPSL